MRNIFCIAAAIIFLFSCKKNVESVNDNNVNSIAGQWTAGYLSQTVLVEISTEQKFMMELPLIVKKKADVKPETLKIQVKGICVRQEGGNELRVEGINVLDQFNNPNIAGADNPLVLQSLQGIDFILRRVDSPEGEAAVINFRMISAEQ